MASTNRRIKNISVVMTVVILAVGSVWWYKQSKEKETPSGFRQVTSETVENPSQEEKKVITKEEDTSTETSVMEEDQESRTLPFLAQAPDGRWEEDLYQDACEETSLLMVAGFFRDESYEIEEGKKKIKEVADWQKEYVGSSVDTSARDTLKTLREYFQLQGSLREKVTVEDIKKLVQDNLLIVPANGRKLGNPYFTPPGPEEHMFVVYGYDEATDTFLVNDPGTKFGEGYRYSATVLFEALDDYPTGNHLPREGDGKTIIVIPKNQ